MSERLPIEIEFRGVDDASDEIRAVSESLKNMDEALRGAGETAFRTRATMDDVNEALRRNKITSIESAEAASQILREAQANQRAFKALAEQAEIFSDKAEFMAGQIGKIASFGSKLNSMFTTWNALMTRVNTAQMNLNMAQERQARLLAEINAKFGLHATSVQQAIELLGELKAEYVEGGRSTKELDAAIKELMNSEREVAKASQEAAAAHAQMGPQLAGLAVQALGLIPAFVQAANAFSTLISMAPGLTTALNVVKAGFMGLYAAMGPIGIALIALGAILPIIIANWDAVSSALKAVGDAIWSVLGPALQWIWDNILKPLGEFIYTVFIFYLNSWKQAWDWVCQGVQAIQNALRWFWDNILVPLGEFIANVFINYIKAWVDAFNWAKEQITNIFNKIKDVVTGVLNWIRDRINDMVNAIKNAFQWLWDKLTGHSIIPDMWASIVDWTQWGVDRVQSMMNQLGMIAEPTIHGPVIVSVEVNVAGTNASPEEIARAVSREILMRLRGIGV